MRWGVVDDGAVALEAIDVLCPITRDRQFLCQAINYHSHMRESGFDPASNPFNIFFRKASSSLAPASTDIVRPGHVCSDPTSAEPGHTAIADATRIRALKVYTRNTQQDAIAFMDYVVEKFPFRINMVRTDRGQEFQALFHWHLADRGIEHACIKPRTPQLNGKVERSHRTDKQEFYQLLTYKDDIDLEAKLEEWGNFYNYHRPHGAFRGGTPYEALREKLRSNKSKVSHAT